MSTYHPEAPNLQIAGWFNTDTALTLESFRGRVLVMHAFQMLCPACVSHGLPQAKKTRQHFAAKDVAVIGLHSVFEHHAVMTAAALDAFIHEYRLTFPIGIDQPSQGSIPATMRAYQLQGTPSVVLIDKRGRLRLSHFGVIEDMALGGAIGRLVAEDAGTPPVARSAGDGGAAMRTDDGCDADGCRVATA